MQFVAAFCVCELIKHNFQFRSIISLFALYILACLETESLRSYAMRILLWNSMLEYELSLSKSMWFLIPKLAKAFDLRIFSFLYLYIRLIEH